MKCHFTKSSFPYCATARAAHGLADLLKRVRPQMRPEVEQLQFIVTHAHKRIDEAHSSPEIAAAWNDLDAAYRTLQQLKHGSRAQRARLET